MATIEVRGYFNKPSVKTSDKGDFQVFTLSEKQKGRNGGPDTRNFYDCALFSDSAPTIEDGMFGTVKGYLNFREYEKSGVKVRSASINVQSVEIAEKLGPKGDAGQSPDANKKDPFATTA